jgi:hypothetical protein
MPKSCSVPGCSSNYRSKGGDYIKTFKFPVDEKLKKIWKENINRPNMIVSPNATVCINHFEDKYIDGTTTITQNNGEVTVIPKKRVKLEKGAVPTIFPQSPTETNKSVLGKRTADRSRLKQTNEIFIKEFEFEGDGVENTPSWDETDFRKRMTADEILKYENMQHQIVAHKDTILDFESLIANDQAQIDLNGWNRMRKDETVNYFTAKESPISGAPMIDIAVVIDQSLNVRIFRDPKELNYTEYRRLAGVHGSTLKYSSIEKLLKFLKTLMHPLPSTTDRFLSNQQISNTQYNNVLNKAVENAIESYEKQPTDKKTNEPKEIKISKLKCIQKQLYSVLHNQNAYSEAFIRFCIVFWKEHPQIYEKCRQWSRETLPMPSTRHLMKTTAMQNVKDGLRDASDDKNKKGTFVYHGQKVKIIACRKLSTKEQADADASFSGTYRRYPQKLGIRRRTDQGD